ncbi:MAG: AI-2E family transporter, partial [Nannocystis sp.]
PGPCFRGLIRLFPPARREVAEQTVRGGCLVLQRFLLGRLVSMIPIGVATAVGLAVLGVPLATPLGILAGLLTFVPYAGPILAGVPIALVALVAGPSLLVSALLYYIAIQAVEGFVITPLVQARVVSLPPLLTLLAEVVMGLLFGVIGVIVSVPLAALLVFLVRSLYVERLLERGTLVTPAGGAGPG